MDSREIAEKARSLAVMVRVQGPDPQGLKMRGSAFHQRENGITTLSVSGLLLPPSLSDSLTILNGKRHTGALVMTTASVLEPFLPAHYRNMDYKNSTATQAAIPKLIPGACIDVLHERNKSMHNCDEQKESPSWLQAQLLTIVDVAVSSTALQVLIGTHKASIDHGSWEVGWALSPLNTFPGSKLEPLQREFKATGNKSKSDPLDFALDVSTSLQRMTISTTQIAFLEISTVDPKDLLNIKISYQLRKGDFLLAMGSPFGVLSPLHFLNGVSVGAVANSCPPDSHDNSLLVADIRCLPGMEGGPVFDRDACLVGVLTRPLRQKNCSAEIQLVITWNAISTTCCNPQEQRAINDGNKKLQKALASSTADFQMPIEHRFEHNGSDPFESPLEKVVTTIVLVTIGSEAWASGILLNKNGLILTNAHLLEPWRFGRSSQPMVLSVSTNQRIHLDSMIPPQSLRRTPDTINNEHKTTFSGPGYKSHRRIRVRLNHTEPWIWSDAKVVYISKGPLDIALLQIDFVPHQLCAINPDFLCPPSGSKVHVIGHGPFGPQSDTGPYVSSGVVTKVVRSQLRSSLHQQGQVESAEKFSPVMLQTTAAVYPGMSGGAVVSLDGRMIGLVTSNVRHAGGTTIPHLNFSLPCAALKPIFNFAERPDMSILKTLDEPNTFLSSVWALVPPPPPSPRSYSQLDMKNKEGKGSHFAKFLAERRAELALPSDLKPFIKGKISSNLLFSKL